MRGALLSGLVAGGQHDENRRAQPAVAGSRMGANQGFSMAKLELQLTVTVAWWLRAYVWWLNLRHRITGHRPSIGRAIWLVERGIKAKAE